MTGNTLEVDEPSSKGPPEGIFTLGDSDPYEYYEWLREQDSPVWDQQTGVWVVVDYDQCISVMAKNKIFGNVYASVNPLLKEIKGGEKNITMTQDHIRPRRFHQTLFSPKAVEWYSTEHIKR